MFPFSALTLLVGQQEGHAASKKLDVGLVVVTDDWSQILELCSLAGLIAPAVTTTSIILSKHKTG